MIYILLAIILVSGCSYTYQIKLVAGSKPQDIKCTVMPDTELPKTIQPTNVGMDFKILMQDLTAYLYNPAIALDCEY